MESREGRMVVGSLYGACWDQLGLGTKWSTQNSGLVSPGWGILGQGDLSCLKILVRQGRNSSLERLLATVGNVHCALQGPAAAAMQGPSRQPG